MARGLVGDDPSPFFGFDGGVGNGEGEGDGLLGGCLVTRAVGIVSRGGIWAPCRGRGGSCSRLDSSSGSPRVQCPPGAPGSPPPARSANPPASANLPASAVSSRGFVQYHSNPTRPRGLTKSGSPKSPAKGTDTSADSEFSVSTQSKTGAGSNARACRIWSQEPEPPACSVQYAHFPNPAKGQGPPREPAHPGQDGPVRKGTRRAGSKHASLRMYIRPSRGRDVFRTARCALPTPSAGLSTRYVRGAIDNDAGRVSLFCFVAERGGCLISPGWTCRSRGGRTLFAARG